MISALQIRSAYEIIRPHIRRTPIVQVQGADFGVDTATCSTQDRSRHAAPSRIY
jgi:hypothetical protein